MRPRARGDVMPIQGNLTTMPVPELLMWISQFHKTGTLEIRTAPLTATMAFENGALTFSSTSNPENTLGRILISNNVVTYEQHKQARALRKTKGIGVAKALLDLKMVTEEQLTRFLRKKVEKEVFELMNVEEGEFTFTDRVLPSLDMLPLRVDISKMLLRVSQDHDEKGAYDFDSSGIRWDIPSDI